jgi:anti-anti-sigma factor
MCPRFREAASERYLVSLSGPLNINRSEDIIQLFRDLAKRGMKRVVVNLEDVPFVDSQGLAALIAGYKIFGSDARNFRLIGIQDQPGLVFELTGFNRIFQTDTNSANGTAEVMALNLPAYVLSQLAIRDLVA